MLGKVEICGVNTAKLPTLKSDEMTELLRRSHLGDERARETLIQMTALIVPGPFRFFGLFGRGEEYYIPWDCIRQVGDDIILVDKPFPQREPPRRERRARRRRL